MLSTLLGIAALLLILIARVRGLDLLKRLNNGLWLVALASFAFAGVELIDNPEPWRDWTEVVLLLALGYVAARALIIVLVEWLLVQRAGVDVPRLGQDIIALLVYLVMAATVLRAVLGIEVGALLATSAVLTVVIGLALQETLGTLLAGLALAWEKRIAEGEWIEVEGTIGHVEELGWRSLIMRTRTGERVLVPNSNVVRQRIVLLGSGRSMVAVVVLLDVGYASPPDQVKEVLAAVAEATEGISQSRLPEVLVHEFAASGITYEVRLWTRSAWRSPKMRDSFLTRAHQALARAGMEIPFPQRTLHRAPRTDDGQDPEKRRRALANCSLFADLGDDVLEELAAESRWLRFAPQEVILVKGEGSDAFYVIASGEVAIQQRNREISCLEAGDVFGERAMLTGEPRSADVVASTAVEVVKLARPAIVHVVEKSEPLAEALAERMAERDPVTGEPSGPLTTPPDQGGIGAHIRDQLLRLIGRSKK